MVDEGVAKAHALARDRWLWVSGGGSLSLLREAKDAVDEFGAIGAGTHASSISYYSFLSLVPLLALCISLISIVGIDEREVYGFLMALVPDALNDLIASLVSEAYRQSGLAFSISTLSLVWSASKGAKALRAGLNAAYGEEENRNPIVVTIISIAAVVAMGVLIAAAMWLIFGNSLLHILSQSVSGLQPLDGLTELIDLIATMAAGVFMIALCFTFLPAGNRSFKAQLPGAACALVGCGIFSFGFRLYVEYIASSSNLYGSLATIALLLLWMYFVFFILVAGGFINRYLRERLIKGESSPADAL